MRDDIEEAFDESRGSCVPDTVGVGECHRACRIASNPPRTQAPPIGGAHGFSKAFGMDRSLGSGRGRGARPVEPTQKHSPWLSRKKLSLRFWQPYAILSPGCRPRMSQELSLAVWQHRCWVAPEPRVTSTPWSCWMKRTGAH